MNTEKFRNDLRAFLEDEMSQAELVRLSGVPQSSLSLFVNSKNNRGITLEQASKLWPIVYGKPLIPNETHMEGNK